MLSLKTLKKVTMKNQKNFCHREFTSEILPNATVLVSHVNFVRFIGFQLAVTGICRIESLFNSNVKSITVGCAAETVTRL